jgi:hypothetical protein
MVNGLTIASCQSRTVPSSCDGLRPQSVILVTSIRPRSLRFWLFRFADFRAMSFLYDSAEYPVCMISKYHVPNYRFTIMVYDQIGGKG